MNNSATYAGGLAGDNGQTGHSSIANSYSIGMVKAKSVTTTGGFVDRLREDGRYYWFYASFPPASPSGRTCPTRRTAPRSSFASTWKPWMAMAMCSPVAEC